MKTTRRGKRTEAKTSKQTSGAGRKFATARMPVRGAGGGKGRDGKGGRAAKSGHKAAGPSGPKAGKRAKLHSRPTPEISARAEKAAAELAATKAIALEAMTAALDKHALEPVLIDVSGMGSYTDFIGIVSGRSDRQVDAIAENVAHSMKAKGRVVLGQEGGGSGRWTLLDFGSFVIHVFYHPVREFYDLESLWIEAPRVKLDVPSQSVLAQPDALYGAL